ncbi:MAG: prolipoprotein diacylglyceryl transferase [Clostridia bacterium]|nr:prolipoprotein diacylglyceryl transferase [Clostridia bacterium]
MFVLREDAAKTTFLGIEFYTFGLYVAVGIALALAALALLMRRAKVKAGTAQLSGLLALACGFVFSRLFFGFMDESLGQTLPLWAMLRVDTGGYSMIGALIGASVGMVISAKITGQHPGRMLDLLVPCLMLFVACERLGERWIEEFGVSRYLSDNLLQGSFLTSEGDFGLRLNTYYLESAVALALAAALYFDLSPQRRPGDTFLKFLLLFGGTQILMESLRYDQHMTVKAYVKLQQVMAMMLMGAGVIALACRCWRKRRGLSLAAFISLPVAVGIGVGIEFMIDRTAVSHYLLYAMFLAVVCVPVALGLMMRKETAKRE